MRFILVDDILDMTPGRSIRAQKTMAVDEELFLDHFPGFPVVPAVLLTEMLGQAAGKCLVAEDASRGRPILAQIKSASFRNWVRPGERIVLFAEIRASRPRFATAACRAEVGEAPVCSAELMFAFVPGAAPDSQLRDDVLDRYLQRARE
ncbi:MAG: 3-hydroxyacyl-ACP dehydratase FabZ family protein [Burkholderiales bacterium]